MNKKKIVIVTIVIVVLVVAGVFTVPRIMLHMSIKKLLPQCEAGAFATDFTSREEDTFVVSNDYYSVDIPDGYTKREGTESLNLSVYESGSAKKSFVLFDYGTDMTTSLLEPEYYDGETAVNGVELEELEQAFSELGVGVPDSYYNVIRATVLLDWKDYEFWNVERQVAFSVLGELKAGLYEEEQQVWLYERDDVRAIVREWVASDSYVVDVVNVADLNTAYGMMVKEAELEDVWKLLNSFEFH